MSLVKIQGNASGTGEFTIAAPNSNTNRTLTLPDNTGTIITTGTTTGIDASAISTGTLSNDRLNTVSVAKGGTGATTLTSNNVILGNGTSAVQFVAPGTSGNVLTSNGTTWSSTAPASSSGPTTAGAVGTYALLRNGNNTTLNAGDTVSGSMDYANCGGSSSGSASGTWRCMGWTEGGGGNSRITTVFLRIS
jgi:hypothetical protein